MLSLVLCYAMFCFVVLRSATQRSATHSSCMLRSVKDMLCTLLTCYAVYENVALCSDVVLCSDVLLCCVML